MNVLSPISLSPILIGVGFHTLDSPTGMWLLILVPFSMVFFFVYSSDMLGIFRKAIWVFYGVVTVSVLQSNNTFYSESVTSIILGVIVAMILIILFDNYIQSKLNTWRNLRRTR